MRHFFLLVLGAILFAFTFPAHAIQLENSTTQQNSCPGAVVNSSVYIDGDTTTNFIADTYWSSDRRAISKFQSKVTIWQSDPNLLSGCTQASSWNMVSNITPGNSERVVAFGANCTFNKPTDRNNRTLQFVYNVGNYRFANSGGIDLGNRTFSYYRDMTEVKNKTPNFLTVNNAHLVNLEIHDNECHNIELRYCGDGLITDGETCDPEHPNYDENTCSVNTCTPIAQPNPQISVDKTDNNPNDLDNNEDDAQTVTSGSDSVFQITVTNTGDEDLRDVVLTDPRSPSCDRTVAQTTPLIQAIGNGDTIFNVGESFTYTCSSPNTTVAFLNTINVSGVGVTSGTTVNDSDPTTVFVVPADVYDLALRKTVNATTPGPFSRGGTVTFDITVVNQGTVTANNIVVTDYIPTGLTLNDSAWAQAGSNATRTIASIVAGGTETVTITFTIDGNAPTSITNIAEISSDDGDDCDSIPNNISTDDGTPVNDDIGTGCDQGGDEDDHDPETIVLQDTYDLALRKTVNAGTPGPFAPGNSVTFDIEVFNQGTIDANNVVVTDYIPKGLTLNDANWNQTGNTATRTITSIAAATSQVVTITFTIDASAPLSIVNTAEISSDDGNDCDSTPDNTNGNQTGETTPTGMVDDDIGTGCDTGGDEDDHDIATITLQNVYDLALIKTVNAGTPGPFARGGSVTFDITVTNQGTVDANNVVVTDYIPTGLTLNDSNWAQVGNNATRTISSIAAGTSQVVTITFTIDGNAATSITNLAEISSDDGDDCDSTPNNISTDDGTPVNDDIGTGCDQGGDEDDSDPETIVLGDAYDLALRKSLATGQSSSVQAGDTVTFTITVFNQGTIDANSIVVTDYIPTGLTLNDASWNQSGNMATRTLTNIAAGTSQSVNITFTVDANASGSMVNEAEISSDDGDDCDSTADNTDGNDTTIDDDIGTGCDQGGDEDDEDDATVTVSTGGGGGGGGMVYQCNDIIQDTTNQYRCIGNSRVDSFTMSCGTDVDGNTVYLGPVSATTDSNGRRVASFTCANTAPTCYVYNQEATTVDFGTQAWRTSNSCTPTDPVCGNGVVEGGEQCDAGSVNGTSGSPCTSSCSLRTTGGGGSSSDGAGVLTWPNGGEIVFGPSGSKLIGHNENPLLEGESPYLYNNSDYDLSYDELCIKITENNSAVLTGGNNTGINGEYCVDIADDMIYAYERINFMENFNLFPNYKGDKSGIASNKSFGDATLTTSLKDGGNDYYNAYFAADLDVRVVKPSVVTVGGGTSYVKSGVATTGDIQDATSGNSAYNTDQNTNFVGVSASGADEISSNTTQLDASDSDALDVMEEDADVYDALVDQYTDDGTSEVTQTVTVFSEKYNGLSNVYVVRGKNVKLSGMPYITEPTTFIVEGGGDLQITGDLESNENVAFVVRGGDIIVAKDVTRMDGTYIAMPVDNKGGHIRSSESPEQLVVNGSLYGDIKHLVQNRYYIAEDNGQLSVGTIVSFGSGIFSQPAPLVSQFIGEYLEGEKVAY